MKTTQDVIEFWFPDGLGSTLDRYKQQALWWMRGGADQAIIEQFSELTEAAARGELDHWAETPTGRLALILVLDQFSRSVFRESPRAFAQDPKSVELVLEGLENGHYAALEDPWQKMFFAIALGHCEGGDHIGRLELCRKLAEEQLAESPEHLRPAFEFSAQQPINALEVVRRFGRYPHRNGVLSRESTPEEQEYIDKGEFTHQREFDLENPRG